MTTTLLCTLILGNAGQQKHRATRIEPRLLRFRGARQACLYHLVGSDDVDTVALEKSLMERPAFGSNA